MGYTEFVGAEAVQSEIENMGLDTSRVHSLQGDGLIKDATAAVDFDAAAKGPVNEGGNGPAAPTIS